MSFTRVDIASYPILYVTSRSTMNPDGIGPAIDKLFKTLEIFFNENQIVPVGPPLSNYSDWDGEGMTVEVGSPVGTDDLAKATGNVVLGGKSPGGPALKLLYKGAYSGLNAAYRRLENAMRESSLTPSGLTWEVYLKGPGMAEEANFETEIFMQLAHSET